MAFRTIDADELKELRSSTQAQLLEFEETGGHGGGNVIDVDKSWDGIHFILCGRSSSPVPPSIGSVLGNVMRSLMGIPKNETIGRGNAQAPDEVPEWAPEPGTSVLEWVMLKGDYLRPEGDNPDEVTQIIPADKVKAIAAEMDLLSEDEIKRRFNPAQMTAAGVYLDKFWARDYDQGWEYLIANYRALKQFFTVAASRNQAVLRIQC